MGRSLHVEAAMSLLLALGRAAGRAWLAIFVVTWLSWSLLECAPGKSSERAAVASRSLIPGDIRMSAALKERILVRTRAEFDLPARPAARALDAMRLDFGLSWRDATPVSSELASGPGLSTVARSLAALVLALLGGMWAAAYSSQHVRGRRHKALSLLTSLCLSVPLPWLAMLAIDALVYGKPLALMPSGPDSGVLGMLLPVLVMALVPAAVVWGHASKAMQVIAQQPWVVASRAKGTSEWRVWHILIARSAASQVLPLAPVLLAYLLSASLIIERVFALEGAGAMLARAAEVGDVPLLIGFAGLSVAGISLASSAVELFLRALDPRRRES